MKLAVRIFALSVVIAGAAAASLSSSSTHAYPQPSVRDRVHARPGLRT